MVRSNVEIALRRALHLFETVKHHGSKGFERVLGFHGMLLASHVVYPQVLNADSLIYSLLSIAAPATELLSRRVRTV